jgi:acyl-CoA reductase-like NAD-dependent aldehyde dehydrogenase
LVLGPILKEAGLPDGVLQILPARGPVAGEALSADARVRVLSLTGSTNTGRSLMQAAARHLPRLSLELGGNAPFLLLPDADLDAAAADLIKLKLLCSGQVCVTANRIFVPASLETAFAAKLSSLWRNLRVGDGLVEGVDVGPLIHSKACERVRGLVEEALGAGAELVCENRSHEGDAALSGGSFFAPIILSGVRDEMRLAQEEIFGPVVVVIPFDDEAEAVRLANATPYGLSGSIWTRDGARALRMARAVESGNLSVNSNSSVRVQTSFGGMKQSGFGRDLGLEALASYTDVKNVFIATGV